MICRADGFMPTGHCGAAREILDSLVRCRQVDFGEVDCLGPTAVGYLQPTEVNGRSKFASPPVENLLLEGSPLLIWLRIRNQTPIITSRDVGSLQSISGFFRSKSSLTICSAVFRGTLALSTW